MSTEPLTRQTSTDPEPQEAARRVLAASERDLARLVLDMHDGPVQYLFAAVSQLQTAASRLRPNSESRRRVRRGLRLLEQALQEIRDLIGGLRPPGFERRPVAELIEGLAVQHETMTGQAIEIAIEPDVGDCALAAKIALYRIVQEALANGYRHGRASRQRLELRRTGPALELTVSDDGRGFDAKRVLLAEQEVGVEGGHFGLRGIQDRVAVLGGTFAVESAPGRGTKLTVTVPCT